MQTVFFAKIIPLIFNHADIAPQGEEGGFPFVDLDDKFRRCPLRGAADIDGFVFEIQARDGLMVSVELIAERLLLAFLLGLNKGDNAMFDIVEHGTIRGRKIFLAPRAPFIGEIQIVLDFFQIKLGKWLHGRDKAMLPLHQFIGMIVA